MTKRHLSVSHRSKILHGVFAGGAFLLVALVALSLRTQDLANAPLALSFQRGLDAFGGVMSAPGENPEAEHDEDWLRQTDDYWRNVFSIPANQSERDWLQEAVRQDSQIVRSVPAGRITYTHVNNASPLSLDPNLWSSIGPRPIQMPGWGHVTGRGRALAIDPVSPNVAFVAADGGGLWRTLTCCTSTTNWSLALDDPLVATSAVSGISIAPSDHNTVFATTGANRFGFSSLGILKSTDQGSSWEILATDVFTQLQIIRGIRVDPYNSNTVVVVTYSSPSFYLSNDGGVNWTTCRVGQENADPSYILLVPNGGATDILANAFYGLYRAALPTSGCPVSWTLSDADILPKERVEMAFAPSDPNHIYLQAEISGLLRSTDGGDTWSIRTNIDNQRNCFGQYEPLSQDWWNLTISVDPNNPNTVFVGNTTLWRSTDGGTTFTDVTCSYSGGNVHVDNHSLAFAPGSSSVLLLGNDGGVYLTRNADAARPTFTPLNDSISTVEFYHGDISTNFAYATSPSAIGGAQDNGTSVKVWSGPVEPDVWQQTRGADGGFTAIEPVLGQRYYQEVQTSYADGRITVTTDGPYSPQELASPDWSSEPRSFFVPFDLHKYDCPSSGCTHLIAGTNRVWETVQGGVPTSSWYVNSPTFDGPIALLSYSTSMSTTAIVSPKPSSGRSQFWCGFNLGQGIANSAIWVDVSDGMPLPGGSLTDIAPDPTNPLRAYAVAGGLIFEESGGHVFQLTCSGNCTSHSWIDKTGNLPNIPFLSVVVNPRYPQQVFAGAVWGLYYTNDIMQNPPVWYRFQAGLPNAPVNDIVFDTGFTTLSVWTLGKGAYAWPLPSGPVIITPTTTPSPTPTPCPTCATPTPTVCSISFTDVPEGSTFYAFVRCLACRSIINGYSDSTFRPGNNLTRGQLSKIVSNSAGYTEPHIEQSFEDVLVGSTFYDFIARLASRSVIGGYPCGGEGEPCVEPVNRPYFRPNANVTRGQTSKIVAIARGLPNPPSGQQTFQDVSENSTFWPWIEALADLGAIGGYPCGGEGEPCVPPLDRPYFRSGNNVTRGQSAKIVANTFFPGCVTPSRK
jgi:photosystem II stability/assembly factor-like uncharacterized protein